MHERFRARTNICRKNRVSIGPNSSDSLTKLFVLRDAPAKRTRDLAIPRFVVLLFLPFYSIIRIIRDESGQVRPIEGKLQSGLPDRIARSNVFKYRRDRPSAFDASLSSLRLNFAGDFTTR